MELSAFNRLEERIDSLLARLAAANQGILELRARLDEKEQELSGLRQEMERKAGENDARLAEKQSEMNRLQEVLDAREDERQEVKRRVEQLVLKLESQAEKCLE